MSTHLRTAAAVVSLCAAIAWVPLAGCKRASDPGARSLTTTRPVDPVIARIREEGLTRSQVMDTLDVLCNSIGPRLTASPGQQRASEWTRAQLAAWGMENAHLEPWGPFGRGWTVDRFSMQVTAPTYFVPIGYPKAWSPGFETPLDAEVVFIDAKTEADLADYEGTLRGKIVLIGQPRTLDARFEPQARRLTEDDLKKLADFTPGQAPVPEPQAPESAGERRARFAALNAQTERMIAGARPTTSDVESTTPRPTTRPGITPTTRPTTRSTTRAATLPATTAATTQATTPATTQSYPRGYDPFVAKTIAFAADEGAVLIVTPPTKGDGGTFFVQQATIPGDPPRGSGGPTTRPRVWSDDAPTIPVQVALNIEDYNRLARATRLGETVRANVDLKTTFHGNAISPTNTIAEIPGTDLADEIVMIGAHLDSWHSATGATDNAVGSACAMEAVRIIKALGLKPRRTIRIALWTGEEQGLFGSEAYVEQHFGYVVDASPATQPSTQPATQPTTQPGIVAPEPPGGFGNPATQPTTTPAIERLVKLKDYEKLSVYFNLDNGTGRIRGIYAQGNVDAAPLFREWLMPFADLDAKTVTLQNTGGTDHLSFDAVGLPGFQFIQDPLEYSSRTHHSNMDVYDRIQPDDAKQASTIMAAFTWQAANMDERFPRKPWTAPKE